MAFSQSGPLNPTASIWISPVVPIMISMVPFMFIRLHPHEHEFDGPVLLMAAKNGQGINPFDYLEDSFTRLPAAKIT
jgi:hypothetical protein